MTYASTNSFRKPIPCLDKPLYFVEGDGTPHVAEVSTDSVGSYSAIAPSVDMSLQDLVEKYTPARLKVTWNLNCHYTHYVAVVVISYWANPSPMDRQLFINWPEGRQLDNRVTIKSTGDLTFLWWENGCCRGVYFSWGLGLIPSISSHPGIASFIPYSEKQFLYAPKVVEIKSAAEYEFNFK